jgi:uncharacterized OsmC-like protein
MSELTLSYRTHTYSTGVQARAITNARNHHLVVDDGGGDEVSAGELFFSGIGACAVNMMGRIAKSEGLPLDWVDAVVEAYRDSSKPPGELTLFDKVSVDIQLWGVGEEQAEHLVDQWKRR